MLVDYSLPWTPAIFKRPDFLPFDFSLVLCIIPIFTDDYGEFHHYHRVLRDTFGGRPQPCQAGSSINEF